MQQKESAHIDFKRTNAAKEIEIIAEIQITEKRGKLIMNYKVETKIDLHSTIPHVYIEEG